ncbi:hypothetical protein M011DRAFT_407251 [Sporormia fimetaria CBS 119925]|uniref:Uncharacterized protein n=1 Tax=Sporormia fimetaria CBS 119925 TaxID=1340428 RepID=A0A6A6V3P0_9PLEO|nr:hypothetical protein M011DRAFT_407251 [Sporormia fimetaria CBS 119925]
MLLSLFGLPEHVVETFVSRLFFILALITIGPWILVLVYDFVLYVFRAAGYEIPYVGGRARGEMRPRAPSLTERPSGHRRSFSLARRSEPMARATGALRTEAVRLEARVRHMVEESDDDPAVAVG